MRNINTNNVKYGAFKKSISHNLVPYRRVASRKTRRYTMIEKNVIIFLIKKLFEEIASINWRSNIEANVQNSALLFKSTANWQLRGCHWIKKILAKCAGLIFFIPLITVEFRYILKANKKQINTCVQKTVWSCGLVLAFVFVWRSSISCQIRVFREEGSVGRKSKVDNH
jgi:hypothetical protein